MACVAEIGLDMLKSYGSSAGALGEVRETDSAEEMTDAALRSQLEVMKVQPRPLPPGLYQKKGTTTLAFLFKEGAVVAVDSRSSMGSYIASYSVMKILPVNKMILGTMAGGAADCQFWLRVLGQEIRMYELRHKTQITVSAASRFLQNILYNYRHNGLSVGTMITGRDPSGYSLYYLDNEGARVKGQRFSVGSGSIYAYGVLDQGYRWDMSRAEAEELGRRAIYHATHRDAGSGGYINVYYVGPNGWEKVSREDCDKLHWDKYSAEKKGAVWGS